MAMPMTQLKLMAKAYYSHGEPLYNNMMVLFALEDIKIEEDSIPVINLDGDEGSEDKSVEVTSTPFNSRCRRLFDAPSNSTAFPGPNNIYPPLKPNFMGTLSSTVDQKKSPSHGQSSTSSTLPLMWWKPSCHALV